MGDTVQRILVRAKDGIALLKAPPEEVKPVDTFTRTQGLQTQFSADGKLLAIVKPSGSGVSIIDVASSKELRTIPASNVMGIAFSPKNTFLQTFQKAGAPGEKNLVLWSLATGEAAFQQSQKTFSKLSWPSIQFSDDETVAGRCVTNEVHLYDPQDFSRGIVDKLRVPGVAAMQLGFDPPSHIACYVPELKGAPASVRIYERANMASGQPVARRSFFKSSTVKFFFNRGTTAVLVLAASDVDKTNQSYYGDTALHYLACDGSNECTVPLSKEGPIHDVQWSPSGKDFVVVHGFMPSKATLLDSRCKTLHDFGSGPRNMVKWSPHGRFICLAGFGNLPGDVEIWERSQLKLLGKTRAPMTVTCEWGPSGRYLLCATTSPRLQVDNGIKILKYDGRLVYQQPYDQLYQAEWAPAARDVFPDLPPSPKASKSDEASTSGQAAAAAQEKKPYIAPKPVAYVHPHAATSASIKSALFGDDDKPKALSRSAQRNKKKREKKEADGQDADGEGVAVDSLAAQVQATQIEEAEIPGETGKKIRAVQKKLRQIDELKKKAADAGGAGALPPAQREKLGQEAALRQELEDLQKTL
ncbi:Eukaryotic translation initiation factor eIF2A family protein [Klebsormidium nitens]|uniref:Eukaryotic translation initiation factor 2A n=1 Tax=Klebsormidium nitens TaxID=105231 RepID=A0A1Y1IFR7_KLENI|nr:Eukaryotic translation initiation factor eIF2A family protein [Klebsormidium nitens]|eukprot:GAQ89685.1 Eukaryotic translation initiation factor eIF2A family protein [Klebsormidium nitens]